MNIIDRLVYSLASSMDLFDWTLIGAAALGFLIVCAVRAFFDAIYIFRNDRRY